MRITPLDIQKHRFRRVLRGYDQREVRTFLTSFAEQYELVVRENHQLREELAALKARLREHEEKERLLQDTLLTARAAADEVRESARREGEVLIKEAELKAESALETARRRVAETESRVVELRGLKRELRGQVDTLLQRIAGLLADWDEVDDTSDRLELLDANRREDEADDAPANDASNG
ncbi:MAG: DivIVA domain-containing protein [Acidobacteriota bacterium]